MWSMCVFFFLFVKLHILHVKQAEHRHRSSVHTLRLLARCTDDWADLLASPPTDSMAALSQSRTCGEVWISVCCWMVATICHCIWSQSKAWTATHEAQDSDTESEFHPYYYMLSGSADVDLTSPRCSWAEQWSFDTEPRQIQKKEKIKDIHLYFEKCTFSGVKSPWRQA